MKITTKIVTKLLGLIDQGLCHGAGDNYGPGDFCVEQAVNRATTDDKFKTDHPVCITNEVRNFGIRCNDTFSGTDRERAKILKRFAVAQLGSFGKIDGNEFTERMIQHPKNPSRTFTPSYSKQVSQFADIAVEVLTEMGSPGAAYLYMCEPGAQLKPEHQEALKKEQDMKAQLEKLTKWGPFDSCGFPGKQKAT